MGTSFTRRRSPQLFDGLGSLVDESATPAVARCALEAQIAIERQKPDRERFWGNADIAFA